jgi:hypothetical protein
MTVKVMDAGRGNVVAIEATGKLTDEDYRDKFAPRMERVLEEQGALRVLINMDDKFEGFAPGAIWEDAKFVLSHPGTAAKGKFEKIALVGGDEDRYVRMASAFDRAWPGEIRRFEQGELEQALFWVKA